jgi:LmbE family N-acetylglucosaminyl deacetylase
MFSSADTLLVLAPHTDDGEFGCGGSLARFIEKGTEVYYVAFSSAEKSVPDGFSRDILRKEVKEATQVLGLSSNNLILFDYEVRNFLNHRQEILEDMIKLNEKIRPNVVFLPSPNDTHQDHNVVAHEGFRAFKRVTMLGYEIPWNNLNFFTTCFIFLDENHLTKKIKSLQCYKSQQGKIYATEEFIRSWAKTRGAQIGADYAEVFEVIRWVIK